MEDDANWKQVGRIGDLSPKSLKQFAKRGKKQTSLENVGDDDEGYLLEYHIY